MAPFKTSFVSLIYFSALSALLILSKVPLELISVSERYQTKAIATPTRRRNITESYVISFDNERARKFMKRNRRSGINPALWMPGVDGFSQKILDLWAQMTGVWPPINASLFDPHNPQDKDGYGTPHAVGCYMAHWHLLRQLGHHDRELRPDLYFVFEDDASCIPNLEKRTLEVASMLPDDWDMLYIGGKPFTQFRGPVHKFQDSNKDTLRRDICRGAFGLGDNPLAPDGTRNLTEDQPYWQNKYMTNTHSYVINPQRIENILQVLKPRENVPIDILLADHMSRDLNVYMTTRVFCDSTPDVQLNEPIAWPGYFSFYPEGVKKIGRAHPALKRSDGPYVWQTNMLLEHCSY